MQSENTQPENIQSNSLPDNAYRELRPGEEYHPVMPAASRPKEVTLYSVLFGIVMAIVFSAAAAYLGLRVGQVFEAAIPIAIIAVGVFMLAFLMGSMFNFLYLLNKERVHATLSEYRLAPASLLPTFAARIVVALLAGTVGAAVNALLVWLLTGVNLACGLLAILPVLLVLGIAFVSFAAIVSLTVRKFSGAAMLSMVTAVVAWFLSGATTSVKYATGALLDVALALPSSYGLSQMRSAVFDVDQSVGGLLAVDKGWLVMSAYALVLVVAAWFVYRKRLGVGGQ